MAINNSPKASSEVISNNTNVTDGFGTLDNLANIDSKNVTIIKKEISKLHNIAIIVPEKSNIIKGDIDHLPHIPHISENTNATKGDINNLPSIPGAISEEEKATADELYNSTGSFESEAITLSDIEESTLDQPLPPTLLEKITSVSMIAISMISLPLVGIPLPILDDSNKSKLDKIMDDLHRGWDIFEKANPITAKVLTFINRAKESIFKNTTNIVLSTVNIVLFLYNGSAIPLLQNTIVSNIATKTTNSLNSGWKTLEETPYIGWIARGISYANQKKVNFLNSKMFSNALAYTTGIITLGFGPIGIGIVTAATVIDVVVGAVEVNNAKVIRDELEHLRSLKASLEKIKQLEKDLGTEKVKNQQKPSLLPQGQSQSNIYSIFRKTISLAVSAQMVPMMAAGIRGIANPTDGAIVAVKAISSVTMIALGQMTEEAARVKIQEEIIDLRQKISTEYNRDFCYNVSKSRKYDLAEIALQHAAHAESLQMIKDNKDFNPNIKEDLKKNNELFSDYKCNAPRTTLAYINKAIKSSCISIADYLHPFNLATNYLTVYQKTKPIVDTVKQPIVSNNAQKKVISPSKNPPKLRHDSQQRAI